MMIAINLCGRPTKVDAARLVLILTAAWRVEILRELKRLKHQPEFSLANATRRIELEDELQAMDELAAQQRLVTA